VVILIESMPMAKQNDMALSDVSLKCYCQNWSCHD
jgi:hypothetical protein